MSDGARRRRATPLERSCGRSLDETWAGLGLVRQETRIAGFETAVVYASERLSVVATQEQGGRPFLQAYIAGDDRTYFPERMRAASAERRGEGRTLEPWDERDLDDYLFRLGQETLEALRGLASGSGAKA